MKIDDSSPWNKKMQFLRTVYDLTQDEAAQKIGVSRFTYGRWERGVHKPIAVYRKIIAAIFNSNENEIFGGD